MKKVITSILAVSMLGAMSVTAFAGETPSTPTPETVTDFTNLGTAGNHEVQVKYDDSTNTTVYSVDIVWGDMQFDYSAGTWNPTTHSYTADANAGFKAAAEGGDKVTITNHTNKAVTATVAYTSEASYSTAITGAVTPAAATEIATAVGTATANAPKQEFTLALTGTPAAQLASYTKVGTLNITLA